MNLARSSIKLFVVNSLGSIIGFIGVIFFARHLGPSAIGVFFTFQAVLGILSIPSDLGIQGALVKRLSEGEERGRYLSSALVVIGFLMVFVVGSILLFRSSLNEYIGADIAILLAVAVVANEISKLTINVLKGELRSGETAGLQLLNKVVFVGLGSFLLVSGYGIYALIAGLIVGYVAVLLVGTIKASVLVGIPSKRHILSLFDFGKYGLVTFLGSYTYNWMDILVLAFFLTQSAVGGYEVAWRVGTFLMLFNRAIEATVFPQVSQWDARGATERIEELVPKTVTASLAFVVPAFFGGAILADRVLGLLFGQEFVFVRVVLIILLAGKIIEAVERTLKTALSGINHPDMGARAAVVGIILNLVFNVLLVATVGVVGAAIGTTLGYMGSTLLIYYYLQNEIELTFEYKKLGWICVAATGMSVVLAGIRQTIVIDTVLSLFVVVLCGVVIYSVFALLYPPLRDSATSQARQLIE